MELCIARYWNTPGDSCLEAKLIFHGVKPSNHHVYIVNHLYIFHPNIIQNKATKTSYQNHEEKKMLSLSVILYQIKHFFFFFSL